MNKLNEIGGFFPIKNSYKYIYNLKLEDIRIPNWLKYGKDQILTVSGRTAIDFIISDIKKYRDIKTVHLPSYLCSSVDAPFIENEIEIIYYDVFINDYNEFEIKLPSDEIEVILIIDYFGNKKLNFKDNNLDNSIVIHDYTHSLLSPYVNHYKADYGIASLRKWLDLPAGGIAISFNKYFGDKKKLEDSSSIVKNAVNAMEMKYKYFDGIDSNINNKTDFINLYNQFSKKLSSDYKNKLIDSVSYEKLLTANIDEIRNIRINNSNFIIQNLKKLDDITVLNTFKKEESSYLFVPIICKQRDELQQFLIDNKVYFPIHWGYYPNNLLNESTSKINDKIMSIVIDQRYSFSEMERIIFLMKKFLKEKY